MAAHSLSDDLELVAAILVAMHQDGTAANIRARRGLSAAAVAARAGASPEQVIAWERGLASPPTRQALAWLHALHQVAPSPVAASARSSAAEGERVTAANRELAAAAPTEADW